MLCLLMSITHSIIAMRSKARGSIVVCLFLYIWLVNHMFHSSCPMPCPIADFQNYDVKKKDGKKWAKTLVNLNEKVIRRYSRQRNIYE